MSALPKQFAPAFDVERVRADFPILSEKVHGKPLVFLDSGASAQKPRQVIDAMTRMYEKTYANVHRGIYQLSQLATDEYEKARAKVAHFIGVQDTREVVFTRNATEAVNLVAHSWGWKNLKAGDEVLITHLEHHANIVPWQILGERFGVVLKVAPISDSGELVWDEFVKLIGPKTRLVAVAHVSNTLGTILPVAEMIRVAHEKGVKVLIDGSQAVQHMQVDVKALDADFYVFTGHKLYGPTGIGVLYAKAEILEGMPPWQGGGDMILSVSFEKTEYNDIPHRFEAGTPAFVEAVGLGAAIDYVNSVGLEAIATHEADLTAYATEKLSAVNSLRLIGTAAHKAGVMSFVLEGIHPHDIGTILDREGIAVRVGQHCAHPLMERMGVQATVRASFGMYNTRAEIDALCAGLKRVREIFWLMSAPEEIAENTPAGGAAGHDELRDQVIETIKTVFDPEIPVNIYELGLIYKVDVNEARDVQIDMTLTSPNCPAAQSMPAEVEQKTRSIPGVGEVTIDVVWDPPWGPEHMSEAARLELGVM